MSAKENPLDPMRKATEEEYFRQRNAELSAKIKARAGLKEAGVQDDGLAQQLTEAGFDKDSVRALFLLPLIDVAWADGRVEDEEKREVLSVAQSRGIEKTSTAWKMLETWLSQGPRDSTFLNARVLLEPALLDLKSKGGSGWILEAAERVALAAGGIFGLGQKISSDEKAAIEKLAKKL